MTASDRYCCKSRQAGAIEICNNRIGARASLNRYCAPAPDLESMLRDEMLKILLQQYLHQAAVPECPLYVGSWG